MTATAAQRRAIHGTDLVNDELAGILNKLAAVQPAEGTRVDDTTWMWVQAFADFDYEYAWLVDVRRSLFHRAKTVTTSDYVAIFKGYDVHGNSVVRSTWFGHPETFPEVPNLYDALSWWAGWVKETRGTEHGQASDVS
jgi:hypothetical protein